MNLHTVLSVAAILFSLGLYCVLTRKNAVSVLMGVELLLNAANLNFIAFSNFVEGGASGPVVAGHMFAVMIIVVAAAEAAIALAIILAIFRRMGTVEVDNLNELRE